MSSKLDLLKAYLKHNNLVYVSGDCWDLLLPFLMLDCVFQIYSKTIIPLKLKHEMKRWQTIWYDNYHKFNMAFFRSFTDEQQDEVIDMMDEFQEWIKNDIDKLRFSFIGSIPVDDIELRKIVADCMVTSALVKAAKYIFNHRIKKFKLAYGDPNGYLTKIERASLKIAAHYYDSNINYNPNVDDSLGKNLSGLCNRMISFLKQ